MTVITTPVRKPVDRSPRKVPASNVPPPLEAAVQESIVQYLRVLGYMVSVIKEHYARGKDGKGIGKFSTPGIPDLMCVKDGITFFIEVKRPRVGVMRDAQKKWHAEYRSHGGLVYVARTLEDIREIIAELAVIEQSRRRVNNASSACDR